MALTPEQLKRSQLRYDRLKVQQSNFANLWQEIADYMTPWRNAIVNTVEPGTKLTSKIYDSTAVQALTIASSAVHGSVTPSTLRWFSLSLADQSLLDQDILIWLDSISNLIFTLLVSSNFDAEAQELYSDLLAFGTGALAIEEIDAHMGDIFPGIRFQTQQPGTFVIAEGPNGIVDTVFREKPMRLGAIAQRWGLDKVSESTRTKVEAGKQDDMGTVLHMIYPRAAGAMDNSDIVAPKNRPIASVWVELQPGGDVPHLLEERGRFDMPIFVPRWRKMSGEQLGRSPGMNVLPDVRTLNQAVELRLRAWSLAVGPPIITPDRGVIGSVRLEPFGRTYTRPGSTVEMLKIPSNFDVANFQEEQLRSVIRQGFFVDLLQFQAKPGNPISATEAAIRFQTMQRILGPVVSRLQSEFLSPLIRYIYRLLQRRNALPAPPPSIAGLDPDLDIIFEGPLARVQRATDVEAINQFFSLALPLAEVVEEVIPRINGNEVVEAMAQAVSLPARLLNSREEAAETIAARRQREAEQRSLENTIEAAKVFQSGRAGNQSTA